MGAPMPERIQLSRKKWWRMPPNTVSVGRGPGRIFGNPWKVGDPGFVEPPPYPGIAPCDWNMGRELLPGEAVMLFQFWLNGYGIPPEVAPWREHMTREGNRLVWSAFFARRELILRRLPDLRGKNLACWCKPGCPCHADVLLELANK
jgi:hypothetical protein